MNRHTFASFFACMAAALLLATPAMGQLHNFPVHARSQGPSEGSTWVAASGARGLNDNSGKQNAFGASAGRNIEKVSYAVHAGYVASDIEELTLAASVAVHLLSDDSTPVQVSLQSGLGWINATATVLSFPVGIAIAGRPSGSGTSVRPWVMPRLDMRRQGEVTLGAITVPSSTTTDIGASAGVTITSEGGAGVHLAVDWVNVEGGSPFIVGVGVHFALGR